MSETFLNKAQLTGLTRDARRTEILRARGFAALDTRTTALEAATTPTTWTDVTFSNSWVNYGLGEQDVQYRKIDDMVQLRGVMKSGTVGATAFNLPVGFRPPTNVYVDVPSNNAHGQVRITALGNVLLTVGSNVSCHFDGIQFSVTA